MAGERVILTYKDYEALPADGRRYELHEGELSVTPAPSSRHQRILRNLNDVLWQHVKSRGLGEVLFAPIDCILSDISVVQPDLVYLEARVVEGYVLSEGVYQLSAHVAGSEPASLPPFPDLAFAPASLWP